MIVSGKLPAHTIYQMFTLRWICKGGDKSGFGDTSEEAYNDWVYQLRYDYWRN